MTSVAPATATVLTANAAAMASLKAIAIVTNQPTLWAYVAVTVLQTQMPMAFATTKTIVSRYDEWRVMAKALAKANATATETIDAACGGGCAADADADGICDDVDDCVGAYDDCGICNGPGAVYECGCSNILRRL